MKKKLIILSALFSLNGMAFQSGTRFDCFDDVSRANYELVIEDVGDETGSFLIKPRDGELEAYGPDQVHYEENSEEAYFLVIQEGVVIHRVNLAYEPEGEFYPAVYMDRTESRPIDCKIRK